jgi:hypothetical protein
VQSLSCAGFWEGQARHCHVFDVSSQRQRLSKYSQAMVSYCVQSESSAGSDAGQPQSHWPGASQVQLRYANWQPLPPETAHAEPCGGSVAHEKWQPQLAFVSFEL